jgi:threonine aldolase
MDRRHFLGAAGLAAATPLLANVAGQPGPHMEPAGPDRVDFTSDGLGLTPREYATLLYDAATTRTIESDGYSNGGLIRDLEHRFARLLGKQAAMFVPTGTLANHLAVRTLAGRDRRVLVQAESHLFNDSGDCAEILSGLNLIPLSPGRSTPDLAEIRNWVERSERGRVPAKVGVIALENPVRRKDHEMVEPRELERICRYAREQGIRLHLDGARMFNLPLHSGRSIRDYAGLFDTVYVSLWKHFNGTSGAMLAGDAALIDGLFHTRRMFGGSLPYAWVNVALVDRYVDRYEEDYAKAWNAAERLTALILKDRRFQVRKLHNGTSRFFMAVAGASPDAVIERTRKRNILLPRVVPGTREFPMQVNPTITRMGPEQLADILIEAARS